MADETHSDVFAAGQTVGAYRIVRRLGKGGMAEVYEVESVKTGSPYALKVFVCEQANAIFLKKRFLAEGRLLARLHHPRIVRVFDYDFEGEDRPYFVMDLVLDAQGRPRNLRDMLESGEVDEDRIAGWYADLSEALSYIHGKGVVHRDVSLENVMVGPDGRAVLSDFGVSKIVDRDLRAELDMSIMTMVADGKPIMGKAFYLAPEVRAGREETAASDLYALGVLLFYLLNQVWYTPGARMADMLAPFDEQWQAILPGLLAVDPADRKCVAWSGAAAEETPAAHGGGEAASSGSSVGRWRIAAASLFASTLLLATMLAIGVHRYASSHGGTRTVQDGDDRRQLRGGGVDPVRIKADKDANVFCTLPSSARREKESNLIRPLVVGVVADRMEREYHGFDAGIGHALDSEALEYGRDKVKGESLRKAIRLLTFQAAFRVYVRDEEFENAAGVLADIRDEDHEWSNDLLKTLPGLLPDKVKRDAFMKEWSSMGNPGRHPRKTHGKQRQIRPRRAGKKSGADSGSKAGKD